MPQLTESVGVQAATRPMNAVTKTQLYECICRLVDWLERNDYCGYDPFDGLNAKVLRHLTFNNRFLRTVLQQGVRRFPINPRPLLGIAKCRSTKGMAFLARGFMRLHEETQNAEWLSKAESAMQWLTDNQIPGYSGVCWGNHFDYQSRTFYLPKNVPTVVWTSLIGHAFLDAYVHFHDSDYLQIAMSACEHITHDLEIIAEGQSVCISYVPIQTTLVHNANALAASLLARTYSQTGTESYRDLAERAIQYTVQHQRHDGSWFYGEAPNLHWIDSFHTAYVLDSLKHYIDCTGDARLEERLMQGFDYWKNTFFLPDGTPRYYDHKTLPLDIQCCSQAIDTLVFFSDRDQRSLELARTVAHWTIKHMQDPGGYFYYRRYSQWVVNKTPTLHWAQATMLCALAGLYRAS